MSCVCDIRFYLTLYILPTEVTWRLGKFITQFSSVQHFTGTPSQLCKETTLQTFVPISWNFNCFSSNYKHALERILGHSRRRGLLKLVKVSMFKLIRVFWAEKGTSLSPLGAGRYPVQTRLFVLYRSIASSLVIHPHVLNPQLSQ